MVLLLHIVSGDELAWDQDKKIAVGNTALSDALVPGEGRQRGEIGADVTRGHGQAQRNDGRLSRVLTTKIGFGTPSFLFRVHRSFLTELILFFFLAEKKTADRKTRAFISMRTRESRSLTV
jgi:hypothetical protein